MRTMTLLGAAALVSLGLGASPASAFLGDACYETPTGPQGQQEVFHLSVKLHGSLSNLFERPKVLVYSVHGKSSESVQDQIAVGPVTGTVTVGVGEGALMEIYLTGGWLTCASNESSPTPRQWNCAVLAVRPTSSSGPSPAEALTSTGPLTRVDPRRNPLCGAFAIPSLP